MGESVDSNKKSGWWICRLYKVFDKVVMLTSWWCSRADDAYEIMLKDNLVDGDHCIKRLSVGIRMN